MRKFFSFIVGFCVLICFSGFSQSRISYQAEAFGSLSSGTHTPFQMVSHTWGLVPLKANNFYLRGGVFGEYTINSDWSFQAGLDVAGSDSHVYSDGWVQQLYGELNWKSLRLNVGAKEDYISLLDPQLSSGDFISSNNARPLPELKLSIPSFLLIPYTKGNMYIKGDFSVGKYLDGDYVESKALPYNLYYGNDLLSHRKSIFFRFGNIETTNKLQFTFGLDHEAQWGGTTHRYKVSEGIGQYEINRDPRGLGDLWRVVVAKEGSSESQSYDSLYVAGSQIGAFLFKWDCRLKNEDQVSLYLQHYFDDGSGLAFLNYQDMLLGLQYKSNRKQLLSGAVFEYIYTKNQTGPVNFSVEKNVQEHRAPNKRNGRDNYYNHGVYNQGYSYFGRSKGTPLLLSPEYNADNFLGFKSNRIVAFHLGLEGYLHTSLRYRLLVSAGRSWGTYYQPYLSVREGVASGLDLIYTFPKIPGLDLKLSVAHDSGVFFYGQNLGVGFSVIKRGLIRNQR